MMTSFPRRQDGAALIVGLILLMVLTVLGVSGLSTATLEVAMADNMQRGQYAFQAAESAIHAEMRLAPHRIALDGTEVRGTVLLPDPDLPDPGPEYSYSDADGNTVVNVEMETKFQGFTEFGDGTKQVHYESRGVATTPSRGAQSIQRIGYFVLAPN